VSGIDLAAELPFAAIRLVGKTKCSSCFTFSYLLARVSQKYKMISVCNLIFTSDQSIGSLKRDPRLIVTDEYESKFWGGGNSLHVT
jgi:hypothetical protein